MNKIFILCILLVALLPLSNNAQDQSNEFYIGYSPQLTAQNLIDAIGNISIDVVSGIFVQSTSQEDVSSPGLFIFGYNRFVSQKFKLGILASYIPITTTHKYTYSDQSTSIVKIKDSYLTFMIRGDIHYLRKEKLTLYSGLSAGISLLKSEIVEGDADVNDPNDILFAFQVNGFGIRYGKSFAGFLEAGFGYNGIINGGLSYSF